MTDCPSDVPVEMLSALERETAAWTQSQRRAAMTHELAEIGMDLARALRAEVMARVSGVETAEGQARASVFGGDVGLVYSRIARAVRMSLALEALIGGEVEMRAGRVVAERVSQRMMDDMDRYQAAHDREQGLVRDAVSWAIDKDAGERGDAREAARLRYELNEVLEDELDWEQLAGVPLVEAIERICADLGVPFDTELWMDEVDAAEADEEAEVPDRADPPDALDRALEVASGEAARPAGSGKPRPP
jgi:hypothetical protein